MNIGPINGSFGKSSLADYLRKFLIKIAEFRSYGLVFVLAFVLYFLSAGPTSGSSSTPQYVYLAYSFLHGKLHLIQTPSNLHDLILYKGYWFVPGAMAPALVLLPFVAIWGLKTGDIWFGMVVGAFNVMMIYDLLGRINPQTGFPHQIRPTLRAWLTVLFAAGTAHWYLSSLGSVWFNANILAVTFMILLVRETVNNKNAWLAGIWLGLAALSRPTTLFGVSFYLTYVGLKSKSWRQFILKSIPVALILSIIIAVMFLYNYLRFHNPFDFGYGYIQGSATLMAAYAKYGGFNPVYFPCDFYISVFGTPNVLGYMAPGIKLFCGYLLPFRQPFENAWVAITPIGMSIFFVTPAFAYIFKARSRDPLIVAAWIGLISVLIPLWMYHNTGAVQFGYRYILDVLVFMVILLAAGMHGNINSLEKLTIGASVLANFAGMLWMFYYFYDGNSLIHMWIKVISSFLRLGV